MQPKTRIDGVKSVVRKRSVLLPLLLAMILVGAGGGILAGRAAVARHGEKHWQCHQVFGGRELLSDGKNGGYRRFEHEQAGGFHPVYLYC